MIAQRTRAAAGSLVLLLASLAGLRAAEAVPDGWFVWPLATPAAGSALDASALNDGPAGSHGRIRVQDGHFVDGRGRRVRFWGANLAGAEAFMSPAEADRIADLFARNGINIVRLHHLDNPWGVESGASLWGRDSKNHLQIDPAQLDRIHRLVAALKARGIYVDVNLKVSKTLVPADGFAETVTQFPHFQKRVDMYDRRMIDLQKVYAKQLLAAPNPYTGLSLAEDPAVAVVETNNENSLLGYWTRDLGRGLDTYPEPFRSELRSLWNTWLAAHYADDDALAAAWAPPPASAAGSLVAPGAAWHTKLSGDSRAEIAPGASGSGFDASILSTSGLDWHVQVSTGGLSLRDGDVYTVEFEARADKARKIQVSVSVDPASREEWRSFGLLEPVEIGSDWTPIKLVFPAHSIGTSPGALSFNLGQAVGTVRIRRLSLHPGCVGAGLQPGQSPRKDSVPLPSAPSRGEWADWIHFLADTEKAYAAEMRNFLRNDLKVRAPITISQIEYGGIIGLWREQSSDFADSHAYWQHPRFAGDGEWSKTRWSIENSPQVSAFGERSFGELGSLALDRVANKPLTVTEYDHPAPSDFVCEMYPTFAGFACRQDWDGLFPFTTGAHGPANADGRISDYFDQQDHPAKWGFSRFATLVFREGLVPAASASAELRLGDPLWGEALHEDTLWRRLQPKGSLDFLDTRFSVSDRPLPAGSRARIDRAGRPAPGPMRLVDGPSGRLLVVDAPRAAAVVGYIGGASQAAGALEVSCPRFGRNFAAVTAVSLDDRALPQSARILVTLAARAGNQGMVWNADRTSVTDHWGHGPTIAERVPATVSLACDGPREVFALSPDGSRARKVDASLEGGRLRFTVSEADRTLDYEIVRP